MAYQPLYFFRYNSFFFSLLLSIFQVFVMTSVLADWSGKTVGLVGTGKIGSCIARGLCSLPETSKPRKVIISSRSQKKAVRLSTEFPDLIEISYENDIIVRESEIVFIGLLPGIAREILPCLPFREGQLVISMMATVNYDELLSLTKLSGENVVRTVPLPSCAERSGPILCYPPKPVAEELLQLLGTPVTCASEEEMKPLVALTGHISSFFELQRTTHEWAISEGVAADTSRKYIGSFYSSLAIAAEKSKEEFEELRDEASTPGGINEQSIKFLSESPHFLLARESLSAILARLRR